MTSHIPSFRTLALLSLVVTLALTSCATGPKGPAFTFAPEPPEQRGRVYIYRSDVRHSLGQIKLTLDGRPLSTLRDREYETLELSYGPHQLRAQLRGLGLVPMGWNAHRFDVEPGETIFLHVQVRVESRQGSPPSLEIGGRSNEVLAENVYILERGRRDATPDLKITTRAGTLE